MKYNLRNGALWCVIIPEGPVFATESKGRGPIKFNNRKTLVVSEFSKVVALGEIRSGRVVMGSAGTQ